MHMTAVRARPWGHTFSGLRLGLRAWALGLLLGLAAAGVWAQKAATPAASGPSGPSWREQTLEPGDPTRYAWMRVADARGQASEALHLRRALLDAWLLALEGRPQHASRTVEAAMAQGREVAADDLQRRAQAVWPGVLATGVQALWDADGPDVPLPPELEALGADLVAEAPGFWVHRSRDGQPRGLYLWLGVRNALAEPLPLPEFTLRLGRPGQAPAAPLMQCSLPRYSTRLAVMPQSTQFYLCRAADGSFGSLPAGVGWRAQMGAWWRLGAALQTEIPQHDQALSRTARILAQVEHPGVDALLREAKARSRPPVAETAPRERAAAAAPAGASSRSSGAWWKRLLLIAGVVAAIGLYVLVAQHASVALASFLMWTGLAIPCAIFVRSLWSTNWADSWGGLVVIPATLAAFAAPFVGTGVAYAAYRLVVSEEARRKALSAMLVLFAIVVLNILATRFF
ncbi:hypothetical protein [Acidovorax lacteus]|uniref:Uncharacterized protein n=1 Tax=Acidovorax lacteus TaxID=1924988 RepID=A0ABP8LJN3_9BURK